MQRKAKEQADESRIRETAGTTKACMHLPLFRSMPQGLEFIWFNTRTTETRNFKYAYVCLHNTYLHNMPICVTYRVSLCLNSAGIGTATAQPGPAYSEGYRRQRQRKEKKAATQAVPM